MGQGIGEAVSYFGNRRLASQAAEDAKKMFDYQMAGMQEMFPLTGAAQQAGMDIYEGGGFDQIEDFLNKSWRPTNLQRQLFEFFGGTTPKGMKRYGAKESGPLAGRGIPMLEDTLGYLEGLIPTAQELGETGFRTDIGPAQDYALNLFEREMVPELAERFGSPQGGSGSRDAYLRAAGDVSSELGAMQVALDEAAAARRLQGLQSGTVQGLFTGPMDEATQFALMGGQVGQNYGQAMKAAHPGGALLGALPTFVNAATSGGFFQPGYPTGGTDTGNLFSALGQTAGPALGAAGDWLADWIGGWGSGGGASMGSGSLPTGSLVGGGDWFGGGSPGGVATGSLVGDIGSANEISSISGGGWSTLFA